jgi:hypothetical protein
MASDCHGLPGTCGLETNHSDDLPHVIEAHAGSSPRLVVRHIDKFRHLDSWFVTGTCGVPTCGLDVAVVRDRATGALQVKILELNARTTFSHYALAAQRRVPRAVRFEVLRVSEAAERPNLVYLTDPQVASMFVAVVEVAAARGETEAMQESRSRHGTGSGVAQHC